METETTKSQILTIATKLFSEKGYDAVGVQEIVTTAGISKPTLYYYYGSKLGLFKAIAVTKGQKLVDAIKVAAEYKHEFFESILKIIKAQIEFAKSEPDFYPLHVSLLFAPQDSESRIAYSEIRKDYESTIYKFFVDSAIEFGNMRNKEALYCSVFFSMLNSIPLWILHGFMKDDDETLYSITHSMIYGFAD